ncbi:MAG TPA: hypothetical protein VFR15_16610, partial [Chloroflexia bacterium]|nr:hypothetical protein [Chloroflexia bacterium]
MRMRPNVRKLALTAHVTTSVGWLGSVAAFLALTVAGLTGQDAQVVRGVYIAADLTTGLVIVPLAFASLLTGLIQSLGTEWGLIRHYWVLAKLAITVLSTLILLMHTQPIGILAQLARVSTLDSALIGELQIQLVADSAAAVVALLIATGLSVYKPRGLTPYGWRQQRRQAAPRVVA